MRTIKALLSVIMYITFIIIMFTLSIPILLLSILLAEGDELDSFKNLTNYTPIELLDLGIIIPSYNFTNPNGVYRAYWYNGKIIMDSFMSKIYLIDDNKNNEQQSISWAIRRII